MAARMFAWGGGMWLVAAAAIGCNHGGGGDGDGGDTAATADDDAGTADDDDGTADETGGEPQGPVDGVGLAGVRRLTRYELDNTLRDILLDDTRPASQLLPEDPRVPFDNDYTMQLPSQPLVESIEILAEEAAQRLVADADRMATVVGCAPTGTADEECMRSFVERFGRLALRRSLAAAEVDDYVALGLDFAGQSDDFAVGVEVVVRTLLQDFEFVYRVEIGTEIDAQPGVFRLAPHEVATRLSYFVWGSTPDVALLDAAESGELDEPEGIRAVAATMLADPRARDHVDRFHSLWLGYAELPHPPELTNAMRRETAALVERVVFDEQSSWLDIFTADETYVNTLLATHYGLPAPAGGEGWVPYGDSGRMGLLSHGSFLSVASSVMDTSPTKRGKLIREQLLCTPIPPPPPDVDADSPPGEGEPVCKTDRYEEHRQGTCAGCHAQMDLVGFGLENYDRAGVYRTHDDGLPECTISGDGEIVGVGPFHGPAGLAQLLVDEGLVHGCVTQQLYRFAIGRELDDDDAPFVSSLVTSFPESGYRFDQLVLDIVSHEAFSFRREEV
ncbi:MAG TPA: DUF1592 domain-containing protein [Nannocystaceae bacterium]|nr:DUF1592 domain-containing protein [Nannocystaceae bacterium]